MDKKTNINTKKGTKDKKNTKSNKSTKKISNKLLYIIIATLLLALVIIGIVLAINNSRKGSSEYSQDLKKLGFEELYNSSKADDNLKITKSEAIKMIVAVSLNTSDITKYLDMATVLPEYYENGKDALGNLKYKNQLWVEYAVKKEMITSDEINQENEKDTIKYYEVLNYLAKAKELILEKPLSTSSSNIKNISKYDENTKSSLKDMVSNKIIDDNENGLDNDITKGNMNKILSRYIAKYNTVTFGQGSINTSVDTMPSNKDNYTYTLTNIDKKYYELNDYKVDNDGYLNAKTNYLLLKDKYDTIIELVNNYLNNILNINYETINAEDLYNAVYSATFGDITKEQVEEYVKYVKDNQIKIDGTSKLIIPAVYFDGEENRIRAEIKINISSSGQNKNLLFGDLLKDANFEYNQGSLSLIVDIPFKYVEDYDIIKLTPFTFKGNIAGQVMSKKEV